MQRDGQSGHMAEEVCFLINSITKVPLCQPYAPNTGKSIRLCSGIKGSDENGCMTEALCLI